MIIRITKDYCFKNSHQHAKCHLNDIDIAFSVIFSCSILATISVFILFLSLWIFVCNTIKIFLFSRFRKIQGVSLFVFTFSVSFFSRKLLLSGDRKIEAVTSQNGLHKEINDLTHILNNSSSCIDLIFKSQPNLLIESSVHPSLHSNCHHKIVFEKFNLGILI